jgi:hypothetical protein
MLLHLLALTVINFSNATGLAMSQASHSHIVVAPLHGDYKTVTVYDQQGSSEHAAMATQPTVSADKTQPANAQIQASNDDLLRLQPASGYRINNYSLQ